MLKRERVKSISRISDYNGPDISVYDQTTFESIIWFDDGEAHLKGEESVSSLVCEFVCPDDTLFENNQLIGSVIETISYSVDTVGQIKGSIIDTTIHPAKKYPLHIVCTITKLPVAPSDNTEFLSAIRLKISGLAFYKKVLGSMSYEYVGIARDKAVAGVKFKASDPVATVVSIRGGVMAIQFNSLAQV